jgi:hypothetical protein
MMVYAREGSTHRQIPAIGKSELHTSIRYGHKQT